MRYMSVLLSIALVLSTLSIECLGNDEKRSNSNINPAPVIRSIDAGGSLVSVPLGQGIVLADVPVTVHSENNQLYATRWEIDGKVVRFKLSDSSNAGGAALRGYDNFLLVVYVENNPQRRIKVRESTNGGITWSDPIDFGAAPGGPAVPTACVWRQNGQLRRAIAWSHQPPLQTGFRGVSPPAEDTPAAGRSPLRPGFRGVFPPAHDRDVKQVAPMRPGFRGVSPPTGDTPAAGGPPLQPGSRGGFPQSQGPLVTVIHDGNKWLAPESNTSAQSSGSALACADNESPEIAWRDHRHGQGRTAIYHAVLDSDTGKISSPKIIAQPGFDPSMCRSGMRRFVGFHTGINDAHLLVSDATWHTVKEIDLDTAAAGYQLDDSGKFVSVACKGDTIAATWGDWPNKGDATQHLDATRRLGMVVSRDGGLTWQVLQPAGSNMGQLTASVDVRDDQVAVMWRSIDSKLYLALYPKPGEPPPARSRW